MLTVKKLMDMKPHQLFATGTTTDNSTGVNLSNSGNPLRWVAVRGGIEDWAIYVGWQWGDENHIKDFGDKIHDKDNIRKLVPCDDEALKMYRH
jgi:hypothetical protein